MPPRLYFARGINTPLTQRLNAWYDCTAKDNMKPPIEGTHLGRQTAYPTAHDPSLLVAVPRHENRLQYQLHDDSLPFVGMDVWHCWEAGFLTETGLPVVGILKIMYPADSTYLVESKSLKLYLNSLNNEKLGPSPADATQRYVALVQSNLSKCLNIGISAHFFSAPSGTSPDFSLYTLMDNRPEIARIAFREYSEAPHLLTAAESEHPEERNSLKVCSHLLRSNCKITGQPDWGSVFISIAGNSVPAIPSLMQYLVSFRNENHFHEEVCEMIYKRLWDLFSPGKLAVTCIYTRRGGIDICPVRASTPLLFPEYLVSPHHVSPKLPRQ